MNPLNKLLKIGGDDFTSDNIVFLLGSGASVNAGIPTLNQMMERYEKDFDDREMELAKDGQKPNNEEQIKKELYYYFKRKSATSAYSLSTVANIENILAMLTDLLAVKEEKKFYNIIGNWDKELMEITKGDMALVKMLKDHLQLFVISQLNWDGDFDNKELEKNLTYFQYIFHLQEQLGGLMKIFTLNHDRTVEEAYRIYVLKELKTDVNLLETGFNDAWKRRSQRGDTRKKKLQPGEAYLLGDNVSFDIKNFKPAGPRNKKKLYLYKLHGSIDWEKKDGETKKIDPDELKYPEDLKNRSIEFVFGISQKYKFEEPYSTLYYEYKQALENENTKILIVIGYSFNDKHINNVISHSLRTNPKLKLIICDPALCETVFFNFPRLPNNSKFLRNIIRSKEYETYTNMSLMLYSLYYSRNFEEDAIFLSACMNPDEKEFANYIKWTKAGAIDEKATYEILSVILKMDGFTGYYRKLQGYFAEGKRTRKEIYKERNRLIYDKMLNLQKGDNRSAYDTVLEEIARIKILVYDLQKKLDIGETADAKNRSWFKASSLKVPRAELAVYKEAALELIDDLRLIEMFIRHFIPIHLSLLFCMIKEYTEIQRKSNKKRPDLQMTIFEYYLKYNYLIDAVIIKIVEKDNCYKDIRNSLGLSYCQVFETIISKKHGLNVEHRLKKINKFLKNVKKEFLVTRDIEMQMKDTGSPHYRILNPIFSDTDQVTFEEMFMTWDEKELRQRMGKSDKRVNGPFYIKSVLHKVYPLEKTMQVKVMLYSKALAKSMVDRVSHAERLLVDAKALIRVAGDHKKIKDDIEKQLHFSKKYLASVGSDSPSFELVDIKNGNFFRGQFNETEFKQLRNKLTSNLNWYVKRYYKILKKFTDNLTSVRFDETESNFCHNLITYYKIIGKEESIPIYIRKRKMEGLYQEDNIRSLYLDFKEPNKRSETDSFMDRIGVSHLWASSFLSKDLRASNLYKFYNSYFHMEEHIRSFGDSSKLLLDKL